MPTRPHARQKGMSSGEAVDHQTAIAAARGAAGRSVERLAEAGAEIFEEGDDRIQLIGGAGRARLAGRAVVIAAVVIAYEQKAT